MLIDSLSGDARSQDTIMPLLSESQEIPEMRAAQKKRAKKLLIPLPPTRFASEKNAKGLGCAMAGYGRRGVGHRELAGVAQCAKD